MATTSKKKAVKKTAVKKKVVKKPISIKQPVTKKAAPKKAAPKKAAPKKAAPKKATKTSAKSVKKNVSLKERWEMISVAAYHKAEKRGFEPGYELQDWAEAEKEIAALLKLEK